MEILKMKEGGFQAFTAALLAEKLNNEPYVTKMKKTLKDLNSKLLGPGQCNQKNQNNDQHLEQKIKKINAYLKKMSKLVLGEDAPFNEETMNAEEVINELEQTRKIVNRKVLPLHKSCEAGKIKFEKEKTDLTSKYEKKLNKLEQSMEGQKKKIASLEEKIEKDKEDQRKKIDELVDQKVKARLRRVDPRITDSESEDESSKATDCNTSTEDLHGTSTDKNIQFNFGGPVQGLYVQISERGINNMKQNKRPLGHMAHMSSTSKK